MNRLKPIIIISAKRVIVEVNKLAINTFTLLILSLFPCYISTRLIMRRFKPYHEQKTIPTSKKLLKRFKKPFQNRIRQPSNQPKPKYIVEVKIKMQKTKTLISIIALTLLIVAAVGLAYSQYVTAQTLETNSTTTQTPYGYNGACRNPNLYNNNTPVQGCNPYATNQGANPQYRRGMQGRCW